ncbi:hypothetical protein BGW36DRAFT_362638 [Talaromyces proteolyticus]|uniref:Cell wall protein n=1 Tax=Talaromyces proteolyticus TaxID=1131652 RepID=A0AAD4KKJ0_9EURO|nr:uncharacterized protein BGW36DRAFT_362638 [Talaromyces proteolyticus]KAH8693103.1 hypothetical protein BGW36DRAFT_362638 [Talaromyces proteolyticus]
MRFQDFLIPLALLLYSTSAVDDSSFCEEILTTLRENLESLSPALQLSLDNIHANYAELTKAGIQPNIEEYVQKAMTVLVQFDELFQMPEKTAEIATTEAPARARKRASPSKRKQSLTSIVEHVASLVNPIAYGVQCGLEKGADNVKAAVQSAGASLDQESNGIADVAGCATAGLGNTVGTVPRYIITLAKALSSGSSPLAGTIFGENSGYDSD